LQEFYFTAKETKDITKKSKGVMLTLEELFKKILDAAFKVHSALGPGLLESAYEECLFYELQQIGIQVDKQKPLPLIYQSIKLEIGYRVDLLVENQVVVELKTVDAFNEVHYAQILTYMKLTGCKLGLLVNFNVTHLKDGIKRMIIS
jgi:GxxExxY protein